jgi:hypothetical protein
MCRGAEIGIDGGGDVLLASVSTPEATHHVLAAPGAVLEGEALTGFLARVSPFGCPVPGSLIRAYSLPDAPFPSILLREHDDAPDGVGEAYRRFLDRARVRWLAALQETGAGLCPALAWRAGPDRHFLAPEPWVEALADEGVAVPGVADDYLGRGLLLLADPGLARPWQTMMSLGGVTKLRKITGREFPVWVDLPAHQPALLASPLLDRVEALLADLGDDGRRAEAGPGNSQASP